MKHELSDKLRFFRRQRGLTQEQLAEAMGVSVAAVSKWEQGQSVPELEKLLELADFFDLSVDALLGFQLRDDNCEKSAERIHAARREKQYEEGTREAEMALQKYPNRFPVVYAAAQLFRMEGIERNREPALHRALDLLSHACRLLDQNRDPQISETELRTEMAEVLLSLGEQERAIAMLRANNPCGINNETIGRILGAMPGRQKEGMSLLSVAFLRHLIGIIQSSSEFCDIYEDRGQPEESDAVLVWLFSVLEGLERPGKLSYLTKFRAAFLSGRARLAWKAGREQDARAFLEQGLALAARFDAAPSYRVDAIRWFEGPETAMAYDSMGATAREAVCQTFTERGKNADAEAFLASVMAGAPAAD